MEYRTNKQSLLQYIRDGDIELLEQLKSRFHRADEWHILMLELGFCPECFEELEYNISYERHGCVLEPWLTEPVFHRICPHGHDIEVY